MSVQLYMHVATPALDRSFLVAGVSRVENA